MSAVETADANTKEVVGQLPVEGSSATTEQQPNTPVAEAPSGVEQQEPEQPAAVEGAEGATPEVAAPEAHAEGEPSQEPANDAAKEKAIRKIEGSKRYQDLLGTIKAYKEKFGPLPDFQTPTNGTQPPAPQAQATSQTTTQAPQLPVGPAQPDPMEQAIAQKSASIQALYQQWQGVDDQATKDAIAMQYNAALREVETLKEQRIVQRVLAAQQQQQAFSQRANLFMSELQEINAMLPDEVKFLDANGRVLMDSEPFQAMARQAYHQFNGMLPQQLAQSLDVLTLCANSMARRFNGAVSTQAAFTKQQVINKQKQTARAVGLETGGEPASPPLPKGAAEKSRLEKIVRDNPGSDIAREATRRLIALSW